MKKMIMVLMLVVASATASIAAETQEFKVNQSDISKLIVDKTKNTKGKEVTKYYVIYKGFLVQTSKAVYEKINLCKKYNANCALKLVVKGNIKRIALD